MTTFRSEISLSESELWALEAAIEFYLHPLSQKLREENQEIFSSSHRAESDLILMREKNKLRMGMYMASTYSGIWQDNDGKA